MRFASSVLRVPRVPVLLSWPCSIKHYPRPGDTDVRNEIKTAKRFRGVGGFAAGSCAQGPRDTGDRLDRGGGGGGGGGSVWTPLATPARLGTTSRSGSSSLLFALSSCRACCTPSGLQFSRWRVVARGDLGCGTWAAGRGAGGHGWAGSGLRDLGCGTRRWGPRLGVGISVRGHVSASS